MSEETVAGFSWITNLNAPSERKSACDDVQVAAPYIVEDGVPMPERASARSKYPFAGMKVGASCFFAGERANGKAYRAAMAYGSSRGWKFSGRVVDGGLRIWRVG